MHVKSDIRLSEKINSQTASRCLFLETSEIQRKASLHLHSSTARSQVHNGRRFIRQAKQAVSCASNKTCWKRSERSTRRTRRTPDKLVQQLDARGRGAVEETMSMIYGGGHGTR